MMITKSQSENDGFRNLQRMGGVGPTFKEGQT